MAETLYQQIGGEAIIVCSIAKGLKLQLSTQEFNARVIGLRVAINTYLELFNTSKTMPLTVIEYCKVNKQEKE